MHDTGFRGTGKEQRFAGGQGNFMALMLPLMLTLIFTRVDSKFPRTVCGRCVFLVLPGLDQR